MSDLFRTKAEFAYFRTCSRHWLENGLCVLNPFSELCSQDHVFDNRFSNLTQTNPFNNKRKSSIALCSKEFFCGDLNVILSYDLNNTFYTDIMCLSLSKEPNAGFQDLKRPRRTYKREEDKRFKPSDLNRPRRAYKREEDKRFKPTDLDQDIHQDISLSMLIKEAPPDITYKPQPSLTSQGMSLSIHNSMIANLFFLHAESLDLRTNPFEEGGDDMNLTSTKQREHEPEIEPAPNWKLPKYTPCKREAGRHRAIPDAWPMPRTRKLKEVQWRVAEVNPGSNRQEELDRETSTTDRRPLDHRPLDRELSTIDHLSSTIDHLSSTIDQILSTIDREALTLVQESSTLDLRPASHDLDHFLRPATVVRRSRPDRRPPDHKITRPQYHPAKVIYIRPFDLVILRSSQEERPEPEHKPNREDKKLGAIEYTLLTLRINKTRDQWRIAQRLIKATVQTRAKPSTLVLTQA